MTATFPNYRTIPARLTIGALCVTVGAAGPLPGCASFGIEDAAAYVSVADKVLRGVARADESARVTAARRRCGEIEKAAAAAEDAETAASLLRDLAAAQHDLADALDEHAAP